MVADAGEAARSGGRPVWPGRAVVVVAGVRAALLARGAEPGLVRFDVADSGAPISWTRRRTEPGCTAGMVGPIWLIFRVVFGFRAWVIGRSTRFFHWWSPVVALGRWVRLP